MNTYLPGSAHLCTEACWELRSRENQRWGVKIVIRVGECHRWGEGWIPHQAGNEAQYTQLTGTHWGSVRSFSMAAWSSRKVLSRLLLTRLRSK